MAKTLKKILKCGASGWCWLLSDYMSECNRKGIAPVVAASLDGGVFIAAVAYKRTEKDRGICFNFCPFCGADICPDRFREAREGKKAVVPVAG